MDSERKKRRGIREGKGRAERSRDWIAKEGIRRKGEEKEREKRSRDWIEKERKENGRSNGEKKMKTD